MKPNREKMSKHSPLYIALQVLLVLGLAVVAFYTLFNNTLIISKRNPFLPLFLFLVQFILASQIQVVIHEGGHLLFGLATGFGFVSFRVGNLMLVKQEGKLKLRRFGIAGTGGQCLLTPPQDGSKPYQLYLYGASLMNMVTAILFALLALALPKGGFWWGFCIWIAFMGLWMALQNGLPLHTKFVVNDAYNIRLINRQPELVELFYTQLRVSAALANGQRTGAMPEQWFVLPPNPDWDNTFFCALAALVCSRCIDSHQFETAARWVYFLQNEAGGVIGVQQNALKLEAYYLEAIGPRRYDVLQAMDTPDFRKMLKASKTSPTAQRVQYARALCLRNAPEAAKYLADFEKAVQKYPYAGEVESERELMSIAYRQLGW